MIYQIIAEIIVLLHLIFIIYVVLGGFVTWRWPKNIWFHLPCVIWGSLIELYGWICPLTPLENEFRYKAGSSGYTGGFIEQYILPIIYPTQLTREIQIILGLAVVVINVIAYGLFIYKRFGKEN
jgi:hypothetical protein